MLVDTGGGVLSSESDWSFDLYHLSLLPAIARRNSRVSEAEKRFSIQVIVLAAVALFWTQAVPGFEDPAPPSLYPIKTSETPIAATHPDVIYHSAPKGLSPQAATNDWTQFLGPDYDGTSEETHLLKAWGEEGPSLVWEMEKGEGYSSPAVQGNRLVFFHRVEDEVRVECLEAESGHLIWRHGYPTRYRDRYGYNNGPRCSPVIDSNRVYAYGAEGILLCLDIRNGHLYWERNLNKEFNVSQDFFGVSCTPLIEEDKIIINIGAPGGPSVAAFDTIDGRMLWGVGEEWGPSYASPIPASIHGRRGIYVFAGGDSRPPTGGLLGIDSEKGSLLFRYPWRSRSYESVNASCPVVIDDKVFISASYQTGSALLKVNPDNEFEEMWTTDEVGVHFSNSIQKDGYLYCFDGRNEPDASIVCLEVETGKVVWREQPLWKEEVTRGGRKTFATRGILRGSFIQADGAVLCLGELGSLHWLDLSPQGFKEIARTSLFDAPQTWSPPVVSRGLLYICQNYKDFNTGKPTRLLCYDLRAE